MTNLDFTMARPALRAGTAAAGLIGTLIARRRRNRALQQIMALDDHLLRDIGLTRGEISAMMR